MLLQRYFNVNFPSVRLIRERWRGRGAAIHPHPVFVFGNQKSGTTAIAALLAQATGLEATLDFSGAWGERGRRLIAGETTVSEFARRNAWAFSAGLVKEPMLTFAAPALMQHFAASRAVFIVREPAANIRSILERLRLPGDLPNLPQAQFRRANPHWRMVLQGRDIGLPESHYIAALARRWLKAAEVYDSLKEKLVLVRYEDFNAGKKSVIENLAGALELPVKRDISQSLDRAFQPRAKSQTNMESFFGPVNLQRIRSICSVRAAGFGYAT